MRNEFNSKSGPSTTEKSVYWFSVILVGLFRFLLLAVTWFLIAIMSLHILSTLDNNFDRIGELSEEILLTLILIWAMVIRRRVNNIESKAAQCHIANVAMLNYFDISVQTDGMRRADQIGDVPFAVESFFTKAAWFGGSDLDDALTAKPVRNGQSVSFRSDLEMGDMDSK